MAFCCMQTWEKMNVSTAQQTGQLIQRILGIVNQNKKSKVKNNISSQHIRGFTGLDVDCKYIISKHMNYSY